MNIGRAWVKLAEFDQTRWRRQERCLKERCSPRVVQVTSRAKLRSSGPSVATHTSSQLDFDDAAAHGGGAATNTQGRLHHPRIKYGVSVYSTVLQRVH